MAHQVQFNGARKHGIERDLSPLALLADRVQPSIATAARHMIQLGVFQALARHSQQSAEELASNAREIVKPAAVDTNFIIRSMRWVVRYGWAIEQIPGVYAANANTMVLGSEDGSHQSMIIHFYDQWTAVLAQSGEYFAKHGFILPTSSTEGPFQSYHNTSKTTFDFWSEQPGVIENFNNFMRVVLKKPWWEWMDAPSLIRKHADDMTKPLLVDVGGGKGGHVHSLRKCLAEAGIDGTLVLEERPVVIKDALSAAAALRYSSISGMPGVLYVEHDFFQPQPEIAKGSLYYYTQHVLHNWPDEQCIVILTHIAKAMRPGYSRLLLNEEVMQAKSPSMMLVAMDYHMAYAHASRQRTLEEFGGLCAAAGLKIVMWHRSEEGEEPIECMLA